MSDVTLQVQSRSHGIWGGEEGLASEQERRGEAREKRKEKRYAKEIKGCARNIFEHSLVCGLRRHEAQWWMELCFGSFSGTHLTTVNPVIVHLRTSIIERTLSTVPIRTRPLVSIHKQPLS